MAAAAAVVVDGGALRRVARAHTGLAAAEGNGGGARAWMESTAGDGRLGNDTEILSERVAD